ncbi:MULTISPECIES: helix-turn-helix domain-containing protein [Bacillus cereus group]|uniref:Helix-turn-helix transcriptional regulator n=1 Tax=Bacillus cereus TaxID=1396 RepID=A0AAW5L5X2_BACCE|nr:MULTISPECIES: helix-turn-helix transcriptional regulator [Bacillus cereus group]AZR80469.1 transcriptional regulator [Bacillus thuringiensis]MCQ6287869.1 helix-turn-helix transcriptional regulator [Bacillus cereus]MCQ6315958.1 helix-turn-helix transcriptional regulator [Bacillus cereus]MCQ6327834.1 helix-turn-helix transcriptional regulator [Bacillus cereus]MCQ6339934.1 helix-turn-helix transcriptional regulator [Bacillus cereus]
MSLLQERKKSGHSLMRMGKIIGIYPQVLHAIECGQSGVNAERAEKIAKFLNKPVDHLFIPTYYRVRKKIV